MEESSILHLPTSLAAVRSAAEENVQHPDGHCFVGSRGRLAVVLLPESLVALHASAAPTHWLLPVDQPDLVRVSEWLPGRILWLGAQPPRRLLGVLADQPLGAWLHSDFIEIQLDAGPPIRCALDRLDTAEAPVRSLARLVVQEWLGSEPVVPSTPVAPLVRLPRIPDYAAA